MDPQRGRPRSSRPARPSTDVRRSAHRPPVPGRPRRQPETSRNTGKRSMRRSRCAARPSGGVLADGVDGVVVGDVLQVRATASSRMRPSGVTSPSRTRAVPVNVRPTSVAGINTSGRSTRRGRARRRSAAPSRRHAAGSERSLPTRRAAPRRRRRCSRHGAPREAGGRGLDDLVERRAVDRARRAVAVAARQQSRCSVVDGVDASGPRRRPTATCAFMPVSRRTMVTSPSARSRGPTSSRRGTPFSSQSVARRPNDVSTRSSSSTRTPASRSSSASRRGRVARTSLVLHEQHDALDRVRAGAARRGRSRRRGP